VNANRDQMEKNTMIYESFAELEELEEVFANFFN
jgi:hypothetical protein